MTNGVKEILPKPYSTILAWIALIVYSYFLFKDLNYFITKKESYGTITAIKDNGVQQPFSVNVTYYNQYLTEDIVCVTTVKRSPTCY